MNGDFINFFPDIQVASSCTSLKMAKKAKGGARGSADKYFVSNVEEPFDAFISYEFILL
jgi:hypothetical protein